MRVLAGNALFSTPALLHTRKLALSQKVFHHGSNLQKWVPNSNPEHLLFKQIMLKGMLWHPFYHF
jgi:hypothetical protein